MSFYFVRAKSCSAKIGVDMIAKKVSCSCCVQSLVNHTWSCLPNQSFWQMTLATVKNWSHKLSVMQVHTPPCVMPLIACWPIESFGRGKLSMSRLKVERYCFHAWWQHCYHAQRSWWWLAMWDHLDIMMCWHWCTSQWIQDKRAQTIPYHCCDEESFVICHHS